MTKAVFKQDERWIGSGIKDAEGRWMYTDSVVEYPLPIILESTGAIVGRYLGPNDTEFESEFRERFESGDLVVINPIPETTFEFESDDGPAIVARRVLMLAVQRDRLQNR